MLVQRNGRFAEVYEFDPVSGSLLAAERDGRAVYGWTDVLGDHVVVLYLSDHRLWLRVGSEVLEVDGSVRVRHQVDGTEATLSIDAADAAFLLRYPRPEAEEHHWLEWDDAEERDLGLTIERSARKDPASIREWQTFIDRRELDSGQN